MGYPLELALRYLGSKKRASISVGTMFAILGVALGVAALLTVMSVTGGFQAQFREKVLGVNAHVLVLKQSTEFRNYRDIMEKVRHVDGVLNVAPFSINPMMLRHGDKTATGVLVKGVDPQASLGVGLPPNIPPVLDLPRQVVRGENGECPKPVELACGVRLLSTLRREGATPPSPQLDPFNIPGTTASASSTTASRTPLPPGSGFAPDWLREAEANHIPTATASSSSSASATASAAGDEPPPPDPATMKLLSDYAHESPAQSSSAQSAKPKRVASATASASASAVASAAPSASAVASAAPSASAVASAAPSASAPSAIPSESASASPPPSKSDSGKFKSRLPDIDADVEPEDPCDNPALVKTMPGIVVGVSLAETLDLDIGDCVTVTSPTIGFHFTGSAIKAPIAKSFRVMAMFEAGFDQYDSKLVYTDLYEAQAFYDEGDTVTGVEMKIDDIDRSDEVVEGVRAVLPNAGYRIMDWKELNHGLFTALLIQKIGMSAVLALIILVAAFTVVATLIMVVLDKKKEISVLKAMGATDSGVLRIFLYQGGIIGGLGTALGLIIGYAVCKSLIVWAFPLDPKVYFISHLPVLMRWQEFALTGSVAIVLCLTATVIPSLYAANIRPAEGFREQ
ncbi:MAG: FtsX-like permease family protein [Polyangiaceae bacterium]